MIPIPVFSVQSRDACWRKVQLQHLCWWIVFSTSSDDESSAAESSQVPSWQGLACGSPCSTNECSNSRQLRNTSETTTIASCSAIKNHLSFSPFYIFCCALLVSLCSSCYLSWILLQCIYYSTILKSIGASVEHWFSKVLEPQSEPLLLTQNSVHSFQKSKEIQNCSSFLCPLAYSWYNQKPWSDQFWWKMCLCIFLGFPKSVVTA